MAQAKKALRQTRNTRAASTQARTSTKTYRNYIGGEWVAAASGEWFDNTNPVDTREVIGRFPASGREDVGRAVNAARDAADKWRRLPAPRRAEILFRVGEILIKHKDAYSRDMTR